MNLEAQRKLKFDRRLHGRRGMAGDAELEAELKRLPDSGDKVWRPDSQEAGEGTSVPPEVGRP
jgi:hypothetical protein